MASKWSLVQRALHGRSEDVAKKAARTGADLFDPFAVRNPRLDAVNRGADPTAMPSDKPDRPMPQGTIAPPPAPSKPFISTDSDKAMREKIYQHAEQERSPKYPPAENPVFGPADPELTKRLVPQRSIASVLPPKPSLGSSLPKNSRSRPILEHEALIGDRLAKFMRESPHADNPLPFYSTGSVIQGLVEKGDLSMQEAIAFMRKWAGQGAATSPRTATPQNMRNAAYLLSRDASGDRLTQARQALERAQALHGFPSTHNIMGGMDKKGNPLTANLNRPGFAMMGMHTQLGDEFLNDTVDPWKNPKPFTFRENWSGNMADVTADTHNIRAILDAYNEIDPGGLPKEWFKGPGAYERYRAGDVFGGDKIDVGAIEDGLQGQMLNGRYAQTEYPIMQGPTIHAAQQMGISPAEAQERLWFDRGPRTGLISPRAAIPDLLNSQIEKTARVLGIPPEEVLKLFARHRIPLAANEPDQTLPGASSTA